MRVAAAIIVAVALGWVALLILGWLIAQIIRLSDPALDLVVRGNRLRVALLAPPLAVGLTALCAAVSILAIAAVIGIAILTQAIA